MASMNISLPDELRSYVEQQSKGSTPSEFLQALIREHDEKFWDDLQEEALAGLRARQASKKNKK